MTYHIHTTHADGIEVQFGTVGQVQETLGGKFNENEFNQDVMVLNDPLNQEATVIFGTETAWRRFADRLLAPLMSERPDVDRDVVEGYEPDDYVPPVIVKQFERGNPNWTRNNAWNMQVVQKQISFMNDVFHRRGYLFLNDVYEALGLPMDAEGHLYGWTTKKSENIQSWLNDGWEDGRISIDFHPEGEISKTAFEG